MAFRDLLRLRGRFRRVSAAETSSLPDLSSLLEHLHGDDTRAARQAMADLRHRCPSGNARTDATVLAELHARFANDHQDLRMHTGDTVTELVEACPALREPALTYFMGWGGQSENRAQQNTALSVLGRIGALDISAGRRVTVFMYEHIGDSTTAEIGCSNALLTVLEAHPALVHEELPRIEALTAHDRPGHRRMGVLMLGRLADSRRGPYEELADLVRPTIVRLHDDPDSTVRSYAGIASRCVDPPTNKSAERHITGPETGETAPAPP